ncbi:hypothetical protein [Serratia marcescens]|uniref:hypothetical protein n=1 Tax=Serratia marcescens TaxID=615 RepID=UPI0027E7A4FB|nr:hypothetical protein [Serratia marcescens]CAJ0994833.1 hypothetical protein NVIRSERR_01651 [Serratia marcescens]
MAAANNGNERVRSVEMLKSAFKEGATPNEKDYGALIDLAAAGGRALGANDEKPTTPNPGNGLKMDGEKLTVKPGNGVTVDQNGVAVKGDANTVTVSQRGVGIKVKENGGLATGASGLQVKAGAGLNTGTNGLEIKVADKSGLTANEAGLAVNVAAGLEIDEKGALKVKVKTVKDNYITSDQDGLAITPDGVKAIEAALKNVSLDALRKADEATKHGFKVDATSAEPGDSVQKKIGEKLNAAFTEGWHLTQPREALFTALKTFRSANRAKIFENGLIAPSAVTGKPGLYNQDGVEYGAGTVIAYKVRPSGVADVVTNGGYKDDGIYALVGKLDANGVPKTGDSYDKVTPQALMVLSVKGVVTVVGHWDFKEEGDWVGKTNSGVWHTSQLPDGLVSQQTKTNDKEAADEAGRRATKAREEGYKQGREGVLHGTDATYDGQKVPCSLTLGEKEAFVGVELHSDDIDWEPDTPLHDGAKVRITGKSTGRFDIKAAGQFVTGTGGWSEISGVKATVVQKFTIGEDSTSEFVGGVHVFYTGERLIFRGVVDCIANTGYAWTLHVKFETEHGGPGSDPYLLVPVTGPDLGRSVYLKVAMR